MTLALFTPGIVLRKGDRIIALEGCHVGQTGIVECPEVKDFAYNIVNFKGRNNTESLRRNQVFVIKRRKY